MAPDPRGPGGKDIMRTLRPTDYVLTGLLTAVAVLIGIENVTALAGSALAHPLDTQSPLLIPVFIAAVIPILWRRSSVLPALAITFVVLALSLPAFGWVTRCGFGLPLMAAYAYAIARFGGTWPRHLIGGAGIVGSIVVILLKDASTGGISSPTGLMGGALPIALGLAVLGYAAGLVVDAIARRRTAASVTRPAPTLSVNQAG
ncbi:hypothetical protein [Tessaracoccus caeni]|uniref:hypothetical protein n=1 Tax=Tessaracoccus caeni TaxID=3031239 RepID=UPI0023DBA1B1|nr:hypothetical protein [Tessaracoccus caeni]MDF1487191.1 hypothetical protein [Tessaracoccus caeni]